MKILHILPYCPVPPNFGGALRIFNLMKQMLRWHDVNVIYMGSEERIPQLRSAMDDRIGHVRVIPRHWARRMKRVGQLYALLGPHSYWAMQGQTRIFRRTIRQELETGGYDIMQSEFPQMALYDPGPGIVKIMDSHNVEYDTFRRMMQKSNGIFRKLHYYDQYRKMYHEEAKACRLQDAVIVTSERDRKIFDEDVPSVPKFIIPNGVDSTYFHANGQDPEPKSLVFTGSMRYIPNSDGALHFIDNIWPLIERAVPDVKLYIVGDGPPPALQRKQSGRIIVTGFVDDVRPYVWRSSVSIVPLRMGGGSRLKIVESLSMKTPVVSTTIGAEGLDVRHGESALIADDPESFAGAVLSLLKDTALRRKLSTNGSELVRTTYDWSIIGDRLNNVYEQVTRNRGTDNPRGGTTQTATEA